MDYAKPNEKGWSRWEKETGRPLPLGCNYIQIVNSIVENSLIELAFPALFLFSKEELDFFAKEEYEAQREFLLKEREEIKERCRVVSEPICHCGESGYYHCSELRAMLDKAREAIQLVLETDALKSFAFDRGDDEKSIIELLKESLKYEDSPEE